MVNEQDWQKRKHKSEKDKMLQAVWEKSIDEEGSFALNKARIKGVNLLQTKVTFSEPTVLYVLWFNHSQLNKKQLWFLSISVYICDEDLQ